MGPENDSSNISNPRRWSPSVFVMRTGDHYEICISSPRDARDSFTLCPNVKAEKLDHDITFKLPQQTTEAIVRVEPTEGDITTALRVGELESSGNRQASCRNAETRTEPGLADSQRTPPPVDVLT